VLSQMSLRSASGRFRLPSARAVPKLVLAGLVVGLLLAADRVDPVAAGVAVAALVATVLMLRHRSREGERRAVLVLGGGATVAALLVALSLPVYRSRPDPLVVNVGASAQPPATAPQPGAGQPAGSGPTSTTRPAAAAGGAAGPAAAGAAAGTEVLGFAASDYD